MKNIYLIISIFRLSLCRSLEINLYSDIGYIPQQDIENRNFNNIISSNAQGFSNEFVGQLYYPPGLPSLDNTRKQDGNMYSNQKILPYEYSNNFQNVPMNQARDSNSPQNQNMENQIITNEIMQQIANQIEDDTKSNNNLKNEQNYKHNVNEIDQIGDKIEAILSQTGQIISNRANLEMSLNYDNMNPNYFVKQKESMNQNNLIQNHDIQIEGKNLNQLTGNLNEDKNAIPLQYPNENSGYLPPVNQEYVPPPTQQSLPPPSQQYLPPPSQQYLPPPSQQYLPPPPPVQNQLPVKIQPNNMLNVNQNSYEVLPQQQTTDLKSNVQLEMQNNIYFQPDKLRSALLSENHPENKIIMQNLLSDAPSSIQPNNNPQMQMPNNQYNEIDANSNNNIRLAANTQLLDTMFTQYQGKNIFPENTFKSQPQVELIKKPQVELIKKPQVHTSIYSYAPPEETEENEQAELEDLGQKNINYRVIFIRAPHQITKNTLQLAKSLNSEQTVIYVLSKKTDPNEIREVIEANPKPTTKPEVHFLKYKTNEEAVYVQNQIQAQFNSLGGTTLVNREEIAPIHIVNKPSTSSGPY